MHKHKKGDTWSLAAQADVRDLATGNKADLTGWQIASQLRAADSGALITDFVCTLVDPAAQTFTHVAANTTTWPEGLAVLDVQFTSPSGQTVSTDTATIRIVPDVTGNPTTGAAP
jgi:hypothetical protein